MKRPLVRRMIAALLGICLGALLVVTLYLLWLGRQPNTTVTLLPPHEWFSHGIIADGTSTVEETDIYGPIAITRITPR